jgi:hypothetical protein
MADEVLKLSNENEELHKVINDHSLVDIETQKVQKRYETVLEMIGEKSEKIIELEADILDMKEVFKEQLECLLKSSS